MGRGERTTGRRLRQRKSDADIGVEREQDAERRRILALGHRGATVVRAALQRLETSDQPTVEIRAEYKKRGLFGGGWEWGVFDAYSLCDGIAHLTTSERLILPRMTGVYTIDRYADHVATIMKLNYSTVEEARRSYPEPTLRAIVQELEKLAGGSHQPNSHRDGYGSFGSPGRSQQRRYQRYYPGSR